MAGGVVSGWNGKIQKKTDGRHLMPTDIWCQTACPAQQQQQDMTATVNTALLSRLAAGSDRTKLLVLQENSRCRSSNLFRSFLRKSACNPVTRTFLLLLQSDRTEFDPLTNIIVHPIFNENFTKTPSSLMEKVYEFARSCEKEERVSRVFIDSLNPLFLQYGTSEMHTLLTFLCEAFDSIVTSVFDAALDNKQRALVQRIATTHVRLGSAGLTEHLTIHIKHKRKHRTLGYKLERKEEVIRFVGEDFEVVLKTSHKILPAVVTDQNSGDLSQLTFNLSLTEKEKIAKDKVQLPYEK